MTRGKWSDDLEIVVKNFTTLQKSPRKYTVEDTNRNIEVNNSVNITLDELQEQPRFKKVNVQAKVIRIDDIEHLEDGRRLQPVVIADSNRTAKLTLWENDIGMLQIQNLISSPT